MTNAILALFSDEVLECIVRDLARTNQWPDRLAAARIELRKRYAQ